jgi:toxin ParE1/3/4
MKKLSNDPKYGNIRSDIKRGYHSFFEGSHTIYYIIQADHIAILDILHQSMDPNLHI